MRQSANAGHNLPFQWTSGGMFELRPSGMPLGLTPDMDYEEKQALIGPGECLFLYSDGLVEAHNERRGRAPTTPSICSCTARETSRLRPDRFDRPRSCLPDTG